MWRKHRRERISGQIKSVETLHWHARHTYAVFPGWINIRKSACVGSVPNVVWRRIPIPRLFLPQIQTKFKRIQEKRNRESASQREFSYTLLWGGMVFSRSGRRVYDRKKADNPCAAPLGIWDRATHQQKLSLFSDMFAAIPQSHGSCLFIQLPILTPNDPSS